MALNQIFHPVSTCTLNSKMVLFQTEEKLYKFDIKLCMHYIFVSVLIRPGALLWGPLLLV